MKKPKIFLADLTHNYKIVASNVFPLGIGLIASYLLNKTDRFEVELFKYPEDLELALQKATPAIVGFANYSWNLNLSLEFAKSIKGKFPGTMVVLGGPNYDLQDREVKKFWQEYPFVDFVVVEEGEMAFLDLANKFYDSGLDLKKVKNQRLFNCHFVRDGKIVKTDLLPRVKELADLGSPYLAGLMDKFFDNILIPMIHTTRGCPFTCSFCTEGSAYYNKISKKEDLEEELRYIAERRGTVPDLILSDANFGMYEEDIRKADTIMRIQKEFHWPTRVFVSTGKNKKERIIQTVSRMNGTLRVTASLQSTDELILKNIKRTNISSDALREVVDMSRQEHLETNTELILGLPGDTKEKHFRSIEDTIAAGFDNLRIYQLTMLPKTEMFSEQSRQEYSVGTKHRINPRSFGKYQILGRQAYVVESEEICVQNSTLPFADYLECREFDLSVEIFHNAKVLQELRKVVEAVGMRSWYQFILACHRTALAPQSGLLGIYKDFVAANLENLYPDAQAIRHRSREIILQLDHDHEGTNEIAKFKAIAFQYHLHDIIRIGYSQAVDFVPSSLRDEKMTLFLQELEAIALQTKTNFLEYQREIVETCSFRFDKFLSPDGDLATVLEDCREAKRPFRIAHSPEQTATIDSYTRQYGSDIEGVGRILMRAPLAKLFRSLTPLC